MEKNNAFDEIDKLEMKLSYLERDNETLNQVIIDLTKDLEKLRKEFKNLEKRIEDIEEGDLDRPNRKPPHY